MLSGLSPNSSRWSTRCSRRRWPAASGSSPPRSPSLTRSTLPLQIVPALAAALIAGFTSFGIACAAGIGLGIIDSLLQYVTSLVLVPDRRRRRVAGRVRALVFVLIVLFMYLRGASLPSRGELVEQRLPEAPRPRRLAVTAPVVGRGVRGRPRRAAVRLSRGARQHDDRDADRAVAGGDHRVRGPDLGRAADAGRRVGVHDLPSRGERRNRVSDRAAAGRRRGADPRTDHGGLGAARPGGEPGRGHARSGRRDHELRLCQHDLGRRPDRFPGARAEAARTRSGTARRVPRT